jgi:hypothetical protein
MRRSLISHDNYDPNITVSKQMDKKTNPSRSLRARQLRRIGRLKGLKGRRIFRAQAAGRSKKAAHHAGQFIKRQMRRTPEQAALEFGGRSPNPKGRKLSPGTRVSAVVYGARREGIVLEQRSPGIVWVHWDGSPRRTWMHLSNLEVLKANPKGRNARGPRIVYNKLLGGWYVVVGPHQTPLNGRFNSKAEAQAWLSGRRSPNPRGRKRPTTIRDAAADAIAGAGWKAVARQVRKGEAHPLEGLEFVHSVEGRPEMKALIKRAIDAVMRAPGANPKGRNSGTLARLKREAKEAATFRGHRLGRWENYDLNVGAEAKCISCDAWVQVLTHPAANQINIGGPAVAMTHPYKSLSPNPNGRKSGRKGVGRPRTAGARPNPRGSEIKRAKGTFRKWHEFGAHKITKIKGPPRMIPKTLVKLGEITSISYKSNKYAGGQDNPQSKVLEYEHETKRPRPVLAADPDGRHVHIVGGRMTITADGLVN